MNKTYVLVRPDTKGWAALPLCPRPWQQTVVACSAHSPEDLEFVAQKLNACPRKTLGWDTPAERFA
ncbi:hypothetical protein GCM10023166_27500 [Paeniglutamicibacter cryotolerans]